MTSAPRTGRAASAFGIEIVDPLSSPLLRRASIATCFVLALLALGAFWTQRPTQSEAHKPQLSRDGGHLEQVLLDLRRTWIPSLRKKAALQARTESASIAPSLVSVLANSSSPFLDEAVFLAKSLATPEMLAPLRTMVRGGPPRLRAAALVAAEKIEPWAMSELCDLFDSPLEAVVVAAIEIAAARTDSPFDLMLPLLAHEGAAVRTSVLAALPTPLPEPLALSLLGSVKGRSCQPGPAVLVALGRGAESPEVESYLCGLLDDTDQRARITVLNALGQKPGRLRDPGAIRALICDSTRSSHERAVAVYCLERTGTLDRLDELIDMRETDPVIQYALGRCLVHELDPRGYLHILELIEAKTSSVPEQLLIQVQLEARILVGRLSGQGQYASLERLHEWQQTARAVVPMPLGLSALGRS